MAKGRDDRLTSSDEVVLLSALSRYASELTDLIDSLTAVGEVKRAEYWRARQGIANALHGKINGAVSVTVRVTVEDDE